MYASTDSEWSVRFGTFDEYFICSVDLSRWMHFFATEMDATPQNRDDPRHYLRSHLSNRRTAVQWLLRPTQVWMSYNNWGNFPNQVMYSGRHLGASQADFGSLVFVHDSQGTASPDPSNKRTCTPCAVGTFNAEFGRTACSVCPDDTTNSHEG